MNDVTGGNSAYLVSAPWRSSGKTMVSIGLAHEAYRRQLRVQAYKKGPDFIDPLWLAQASGRPCYNLDPWCQQTDEIVDTYRRYMTPSTFGLVEGTMGLHDGLHSDGRDSNCAIAKMLGLKVVLVVDCRGMHRTIAALIKGLQQFDPDLEFAGVVLNRIRSGRHGSKVQAAIRDHTDLPVIGEIPESDVVTIAEKQLGLVPMPECSHSSDSIESIADLLREHCDTESLFEGVEAELQTASTHSDTTLLTIGIAKDEAFHFYYQDDLEVFRAHGAHLVEISPLRDELPADLDGLIIGGGFPERHAQALMNNTSFRQSLKSAIENGLPVHAECAGLMYLCRTLSVDERHFDMVGVFDAAVNMQKKPVGRGYVRLRRLSDNAILPAHEFHHSQAEFNPEPAFAYAVERGYGIDGQSDGVCRFNAHAGYAHFRHTRQSPWVDAFISRVHMHIQSGQHSSAPVANGVN